MRSGVDGSLKNTHLPETEMLPQHQRDHKQDGHCERDDSEGTLCVLFSRGKEQDAEQEKTEDRQSHEDQREEHFDEGFVADRAV